MQPIYKNYIYIEYKALRLKPHHLLMEIVTSINSKNRINDTRDGWYRMSKLVLVA